MKCQMIVFSLLLTCLTIAYCQTVQQNDCTSETSFCKDNSILVTCIKIGVDTFVQTEDACPIDSSCKINECVSSIPTVLPTTSAPSTTPVSLTTPVSSTSSDQTTSTAKSTTTTAQPTTLTMQPRPTTKKPFECTRIGFFPGERCEEYYKCILFGSRFYKINMRCWFGKWFNPITRFCVFPMFSGCQQS